MVIVANPQASPPVTAVALRALRASYIWGPATRQPQLGMFARQEGSTAAVVVGNRKSSYDYFKLLFLMISFNIWSQKQTAMLHRLLVERC